MEDLTASDNNGLDYAILESLNTHGEPMGSGTLHYALRKQGSTPSAPTIGRKLRDLEQRGLVAKVSVEGRILTAAGQKLLKNLQQERQREVSGERLLKLLKRNGRKDIVNQLQARRLIEGEACALAAEHATAEQVARLEQLVREGRQMVEQGEMGVKQDTDFHDLIAEASGNSVLAAIVVMLRSQAWLNSVIAAIRSKVGTRLVVDHDEVIKAIREKKPKQAREAMERHLSRLISDVDHYWEQVFSHDHR
jgi:GntR family transcriptional regulator, transcriptional repressor for pyruvate dehydrogenase complex